MTAVTNDLSCKQVEATTYVNAIGGMEMYNFNSSLNNSTTFSSIKQRQQNQQQNKKLQYKLRCVLSKWVRVPYSANKANAVEISAHTHFKLCLKNI